MGDTTERPLIEVARETTRFLVRNMVEGNTSNSAFAYVAGYEDKGAEMADQLVAANKRIAELEVSIERFRSEERENWETMNCRDARIAELEAQLAAHEAKRFHNGKQVLDEYAARPVQGVVVTDEMVEVWARTWFGPRVVCTVGHLAEGRRALIAALSSAKIVPLASETPARFMCLGRNITHTDSGDGYNIPLYRGFPEAPNGNE